MKQIMLATAILAATAAGATADSFGQPCTATPQETWLSLPAIEKIVTDHGYTITKSRMKDACAEIYATDKQGTRVEFFIDPATGNPVGADVRASAQRG